MPPPKAPEEIFPEEVTKNHLISNEIEFKFEVKLTCDLLTGVGYGHWQVGVSN